MVCFQVVERWHSTDPASQMFVYVVVESFDNNMVDVWHIGLIHSLHLDDLGSHPVPSPASHL